ncbi:NAD-dependent epimerase/dehydratase family protein [Glacieibacterium megasporae]|uniref:NAD-dependent epimerase/dehydratase family protein n=1 Tax=Glacieibacterium megasporae TaxID=2835787 RepID=UPI001C1E4092|nr:NAD-dependent epimerase/dehydratase family protein [Polymorphobacter megasporae]UAJ12572.1 NAD-dependent epimerase/dehydratase family protein [Polymorphobacter megasporae]
MRQAGGVRVVVTGAAGFIGRAVVDRIERGALGPVTELRLNDVQAFERPSAVVITGTYADPHVRARLVECGVDVLFHLASLPGGAAEREPALGRSVNLDGSLALLNAVAGNGAPVVVYTSSIAALGRADQIVTDSTALRPSGSYGTHKAMVELYLADLTRRGLVDGRAIRPAGIVARPRGAYAGFATAWMSDLFHAAVERRDIAVPARADSHIWLQSVDAVADNTIHAAMMSAAALAAHRAWTLPATVVRLESLVAALAKRTGHALRVDYGGGKNDQPPLDASAAFEIGFVSDGNTEALVDAVIARIERG